MIVSNKTYPSIDLAGSSQKGMDSTMKDQKSSAPKANVGLAAIVQANSHHPQLGCLSLPTPQNKYVALEKAYPRLFGSASITETSRHFDNVTEIPTDLEAFEICSPDKKTLGIEFTIGTAICMKALTKNRETKVALKFTNLQNTLESLQDLKEEMKRLGCIENSFEVNIVGGWLPSEMTPNDDEFEPFEDPFNHEKAILEAKDESIKGVRLHVVKDFNKGVSVVIEKGRVFFANNHLFDSKVSRRTQMD